MMLREYQQRTIDQLYAWFDVMMNINLM